MDTNILLTLSLLYYIKMTIKTHEEKIEGLDCSLLVINCYELTLHILKNGIVICHGMQE